MKNIYKKRNIYKKTILNKKENLSYKWLTKELPPDYIHTETDYKLLQKKFSDRNFQKHVFIIMKNRRIYNKIIKKRLKLKLIRKNEIDWFLKKESTKLLKQGIA